MIVKVQISQASSDGVKRMLVYNEDKSVQFEDVVNKAVLKAMKGQPKKYFNAKVVPHSKNWMKGEKEINLINEAEWQNW